MLIRLQTPHHGIVEYDVLHILEFSSERKCMSIIVRERNHKGRLMLYSKGADSTIYSNLPDEGMFHLQQNGEGLTMASVTLGHVDSYAQRGLRTLCMARRVGSKPLLYYLMVVPCRVHYLLYVKIECFGLYVVSSVTLDVMGLPQILLLQCK